MTIAVLITLVAVQSKVIKDSAEDLIQPQAYKQVAKRGIDNFYNHNLGTQYGFGSSGGSDPTKSINKGSSPHRHPDHDDDQYIVRPGSHRHPDYDIPCNEGPCHNGAYNIYPVDPYPSEYGVSVYERAIYPGPVYQKTRIQIPSYPGSGYGAHTSYRPRYGGYNSG